MKEKIIWKNRVAIKRFAARMLCFVMFLANMVGADAAENPPTAVRVLTTMTNVTAVFDKEEYQPGDLVNITLTPNEGYILHEQEIQVLSGTEPVDFELKMENEIAYISFQLLESEVEVTATAKKKHQITCSYKDMYGKDGGYLFDTVIAEEFLIEGKDVAISVNYKGEIGWTAKVSGASGIISHEMTEQSIQFVMPDEDVVIEIEEIEVYNKGDLSTEDTILGEDIGKEHQTTTSKEYEPDVSLGKSAKWDDIEEGLATLTLTQKSSSDWSDNPSDYIIVLDRTVSMSVDYSIVYGENSDNMGFGCSVCLNPKHYYKYNGKNVTLIDYGHGFYTSSGEYFSTDSFMGNEEAIWEHHYDSTGKKIAPRVYNGCIDRLSIAQNSIKDILDVLEAQNKKELAGGKKNRVMYWSFSGGNELNDGTWDEIPEFTEDMQAVKNAMKYESYPGTYYYRSFVQILEKLKEKSKDSEHKDIPTKVIFISDGVLYDKNPDAISDLAKEIRETPNTKLYTILIGNSKDSEAGKRLESYATNSAHFATVTNNWDVFVDTITAIQKDQFEIKATNKVVTDKINTKYWEVVGEPIVESGNGTASLDSEKKTLTWKLPGASDKTYTCKLKLKLKDKYRYLLSDTSYPTNADEEGATEELILKEPEKAGGMIRYKITGGKYNGESRTVGVKSPDLKYGTVAFEGNKHWTVSGSCAEKVEVVLKRTMPGTQNAVEINNTVTNVTKNWKYSFKVRQMPDGTTYPLIKYNNAGEKVSYEVHENVPEYYTKVDQTKQEKDGVIISDFYNEPFKVKAQIMKVDEETRNPLSGAKFSVYTWSEELKTYVPYKGTKDSMNGAEKVVQLKEEGKGTYITPVWLYYSTDNLGKFRIIEAKAPKGYFGDWKDKTVTNSEEDKNVYDFEISADASKNGKTMIVPNEDEQKIGNQRVKGQIIFTKYDLEGQVSTAQGEASLSDAVYKLYAAEDIVHQDGTTGVLYKKDQEIKVSATANLKGVNVYTCDPQGNTEIKTASAATVRIDGLELGKYYIKEVQASKGYLIDPEKYVFDVAYVDEKTEMVSVHGNVNERVMKQSLNFYKYTADNNSDVLEPMVGAGFSVYLVSELEDGRYQELSDEDLVQAVIDDLRNPVTLRYDTYEKYSPASVFADHNSEDVMSGRLVKKVSYEDKKTYEVSGLNEYLVAELEADENGVVKVPALPYGRYIIIETTTPSGKTATRPFVMNVVCDEKDQTVDGDGKGTPLQDKQLTVLIDRSIMSLVKIMKRDANSKQIVLKEGASYVIHDIEGAWFDYITNEMTTAQKKEYEKKYGDLVVQYSQGIYYGTSVHPFTTKIVEDGEETQNVYIETPLQLPSGTYELEEISAPEGYILQGHEGVIAKEYSKSGNGTYYEAEEEGHWKAVPQGRVKFIVSNNESVYDTNIRSYVTTVRQDNEPAIGKISIYVQGERLIDAKKGKSSEDYEFEYALCPVEGAKFEIRAGEDIYSQEGGANAVKLFSKGEVVVKLTTNEEGKTWTGQQDWEGTDIAKGLPLGKYEIVQVEAGEGFYLSEENKTPVEVEIRYAGEEIPVIYKSSEYQNPRQTVKIEVNKTDAETGDNLAGAVFGLYSKEEIKNYKGKVVVKADTLIAKAQTTSDKENAVFAADVPFGAYYVKELKAPEGYVACSEIFEVDASDTGENGSKMLKFHYELTNRKTEIKIRKTDLYTGADIEGAKLCVVEKDSQKTIAEWTTNGKEKILEGLKISDTEETVYVLKETAPAEGYVTAEDLIFKLVQGKNDAGEYLNTVKVLLYKAGEWKELSENMIEMKDDITRVEIQKVNGKTRKMLSGAKLELRDGNGKVRAVWTSSEKEGFTLERLPIGTYRIVEREQMNGYKAAKPLVIKVLDTAQKQVFVFENIPEEKAPEVALTEKPKNPPTIIKQQIAAVSTGDYAPVALCIGAIAASLAGFGIARKRRK